MNPNVIIIRLSDIQFRAVNRVSTDRHQPRYCPEMLRNFGDHVRTGVSRLYERMRLLNEMLLSINGIII